ncbi:hypothetical protein OJAV_G00086140 [Oryzias javanicus]|uniref:SHSP domain-containing protein n=1 Tax=Oryzias javanicus TaxID=123683 RepID=A0A437CZ56_ORYJA|nr:hypothetical protein OJAV_G00086140 [Oryzias javanicus]
MERAKSCEEWYPLRRWWQPGWCFSPDVGLPPSLERGDPFQRSFLHRPSLKVDTWGVSMDVAHFSPAEISLSVRDGFLEVRGKHEEKPDQHGFISRCFTRKYRLPAEVNAAKLVSSLSVDGILTVEAPVPETSVPAAFLIPIQVENEDSAEQEVEEKDQIEEESESGVDQSKPGSSTAELQHEEQPEPAEDEEEKSAESQEMQNGSNQPEREDPKAQEKVDQPEQLLPSEEQNRVLEEQNRVQEEQNRVQEEQNRVLEEQNPVQEEVHIKDEQ